MHLHFDVVPPEVDELDDGPLTRQLEAFARWCAGGEPMTVDRAAAILRHPPRIVVWEDAL
ncbi:MAG: hypothetical protein AB7O38_02080 [Pirellulaceae bacterium]